MEERLGNGSVPSKGAGGLGVSGARVIRATELEPVETNNWLMCARFVRKEFDLCRLLVEEELEKTRGQAEYALVLKGLVLRREGRLEESLEAFHRAHLANPTDGEVAKHVGRSLLLAGRHLLAAEAYLRAEQLAPAPDWDIYCRLGEVYGRLGRVATARDYLRKAVNLGRTERAYQSLAQLQVEENDLNGALDTYRQALELWPDNTALGLELGLLLRRVGLGQEAFQRLGTVLAIQPGNVAALLALGTMALAEGEPEVGLSKLKLAGQALPESAPLWNNMGLAFFAKGKLVAGISCLKRAHYLDPLDWRTAFNLGLVHTHTKQFASAFVYLSQAAKLRPRHAPAFLLLGIALRHLGDPDNATKCLEQALRLDPDDTTILTNLTIHLVGLGRVEEAAQQLAALQAASPPPPPPLQQTLSQLASRITAARASSPNSDLV